MAILAKRGDGVLIFIGIAIAVLGLGLWSWASPSPHRYIELLFALPITCFGLLFIGGTLVFGHRDSKGLWFWVGALASLVAISPLLFVAGLLMLSVVA
jgi:hypothetical protein